MIVNKYTAGADLRRNAQIQHLLSIQLKKKREHEKLIESLREEHKGIPFRRQKYEPLYANDLVSVQLLPVGLGSGPSAFYGHMERNKK